MTTVDLTTTEAYLTMMVGNLRDKFQTQVHHLASVCCVEGTLNERQLDRWQVPSYELAFAAAELSAAERVLSNPIAANSDLRDRLIVTFVAELCRTVLERLQQVSLDIEPSGAEPLHALIADRNWHAVCRYFVDARVLSIFEGTEETLALKVVARDLYQRALRRGAV